MSRPLLHLPAGLGLSDTAYVDVFAADEYAFRAMRARVGSRVHAQVVGNGVVRTVRWHDGEVHFTCHAPALHIDEPQAQIALDCSRACDAAEEQAA